MSVCTGYVYCAECGLPKAPLGRSVAMEMANSMCDFECPGYQLDPKPDCRWPGEEFCGPGCMRGDA